MIVDMLCMNISRAANIEKDQYKTYQFYINDHNYKTYNAFLNGRDPLKIIDFKSKLFSSYLGVIYFSSSTRYWWV